jgi:putative ABC transport system permease protein
MNMESFAASFVQSGQAGNAEKYPNTSVVEPNKMIGGMLDTLSQTYGTNDLVAFRQYLVDNKHLLDESKISAISYTYNFNFDLYQKEADNSYRKINYLDSNVNTYLPNGIDKTVKTAFESVYPTFRSMMSSGTWGEMLGNNDLIKLQYDLLHGANKKSVWPNQNGPDENGAWPVMIVVDEYNRIPDYSLFMMGLLTDEEVKYMMAEMVYKMEYTQHVNNKTAEERLKEEFGEDFKPYKNAITFDDLIGREYEVLLKGQYFTKSGSVSPDGTMTFHTYEKTNDAATLLNNGQSTKIKVCGILRLKEGASAGALSQSIYYTPKFTEYLIDKTQELPVVKDQLDYLNFEDDDTGVVFSVITYDGNNWFHPSSDEGSKRLANTAFELGMVDKEDPLAISIYPTSFENKDYVVELINNYNKTQDSSKKIQYTDYIGMMISSITVIIDAITYILIAFVSISLIVSSIMIGVITYISVLERTKEIGVLRAMGASKRDIARVFNAETVIIGFVSGMLGIIITVLLNIPISLIIKALAGIPGISALPMAGGIVLVLISVILTLIAGIIPSGMASKKDPVIALRSE